MRLVRDIGDKNCEEIEDRFGFHAEILAEGSNPVMSEQIYPDPASDGIDFEPTEWELAEMRWPHHIPTHSMWRIGCNDSVKQKGEGSIFDFYAELGHVCEGWYGPDEGFDQETLTFLGRGAVAFYLQARGVWKPNMVEFPDRPEHRAESKISEAFPMSLCSPPTQLSTC
jgi:hypothetical protein